MGFARFIGNRRVREIRRILLIVGGSFCPRSLVNLADHPGERLALGKKILLISPGTKMYYLGIEWKISRGKDLSSFDWNIASVLYDLLLSDSWNKSNGKYVLVTFFPKALTMMHFLWSSIVSVHGSLSFFHLQFFSPFIKFLKAYVYLVTFIINSKSLQFTTWKYERVLWPIGQHLRFPPHLPKVHQYRRTKRVNP